MPVYSVDALTRNADSLQQAQQLTHADVALHQNDMERLGLNIGDLVEVTQDGLMTRLKCRQDNHLLEGTVYIPRGLAGTEYLGSVYGQIEIRKAEGGAS